LSAALATAIAAAIPAAVTPAVAATVPAAIAATVATAISATVATATTIALSEGGSGCDDAGDDLGSGEPASEQQGQRGGPISRDSAACGHERSFADDAISTRWDG
jgi:hypothetical protein